MAFTPKSSEPPMKKIKHTVIRNVLCAPSEDEWPKLLEKETEILKAELKKNLTHLKVSRVIKPWKDMKKMSKENRKTFAKEIEEKSPEVLASLEAARQTRHWLFLGINAVSRAIESGTISCCLLAEDVTPSNLVQHVVKLASHAKVPVFLVSDFKKFCKETMGFSCIALGFTKPCDLSTEPNGFKEIRCLVGKFYQNWENDRKKPTKPQIVQQVVEKPKEPPPPVVPVAIKTSEPGDFLSSPSSFHLLRRSKYERTFTPDSVSDPEDVEIPPADKSPTKKSAPKSVASKYKLPTILRIRNNPFKLKRKKKKKKNQ